MDYFWEIWDSCSVSGFPLVCWVESEFVVFVLGFYVVVILTWNKEGCFFIWSTVDDVT